MKFNQEKAAITSGLESQSFSFKFNSHVAKLMSDSVYEDKPLATVREICTNAWDANHDVPFVVTLPSDFSTTFSVRDFGKGLSQEEMHSLYSTFFSSGSLGSDEKVGGFGLGSKAPLALVDSFKVVSYQNGISKEYLIYKDASMPNITMVKEEETLERDGLLVQVEIEEKYTRKICEYSAKVCYNLRTTSGQLPVLPEFVVERYDYKEEHRVPFKDGFRLLGDSKEPRMYSGEENSVMLTGVIYPIKINDEEVKALILEMARKKFLESKGEDYVSQLMIHTKEYSKGMQILMGSGEVYPSLSRESLSLEGDTLAVVTKRVAEARLAMSVVSVDELMKVAGRSILSRLDFGFNEVEEKAYPMPIPLFDGMALKKGEIIGGDYDTKIRITTIHKDLQGMVEAKKLLSSARHDFTNSSEKVAISEDFKNVSKILFVYDKTEKNKLAVERRVQECGDRELAFGEKIMLIEIYGERYIYDKKFLDKPMKPQPNMTCIEVDLFETNGEKDDKGWHTTTIQNRKVKCKLIKYLKLGKDVMDKPILETKEESKWAGKTKRFQQIAGDMIELPSKEELLANVEAVENGKKVKDYLVVFKLRTLSRQWESTEAVQFSRAVNAARQVSRVEMFWKQKYEPVIYQELTELRKFKVFVMIEKDYNQIFGRSKDSYSMLVGYLRYSYAIIEKNLKDFTLLSKQYRKENPEWLSVLLFCVMNNEDVLVGKCTLETKTIEQELKDYMAGQINNSLVKSNLNNEVLKELIPEKSEMFKNIEMLRDLKAQFRNQNFSIIKRSYSSHHYSEAYSSHHYSEAYYSMATEFTNMATKTLRKVKNFGGLIRMILVGTHINGKDVNFGGGMASNLKIARFSDGSKEERQKVLNSILMGK